MESDENIIVATSEIFANTYYIFRPIRDSGYLEIKVVLDNEKRLIKTSIDLTEAETKYFKAILIEGRMNRLLGFEKYNDDPEKTYRDSQLEKKEEDENNKGTN